MPRPSIATLVTSVIFLALTGAHAQDLSPDSRVKTGRLDNGLTYHIMQHATPPGRAGVWMHVSSGSLNEAEKQRGVAHYLEHMAFNGSENFNGNDVVTFFESMGLTFGQHQNAFTSFDQTVYQLALPKNDRATLDNAFLFFSDVLDRLDLDDGAIDGERGVILEELRSGLGPWQRIQDHILANISPGSLLGERLPIGTEASIKALTRDDFVAYYEKFYTPSNTTLAVVADMDPAEVEAAIIARFDKVEARPRADDQDPAVSPPAEPRAIVAPDAEIRQALVSIALIGKPEPPTTTEQLFRTRVIETAAVMAFNRRLARKIREGGTPFLAANGSVGDQFNAFRQVGFSAIGDPARYKDALRELAREIQRARLNGFTAQEIDDVRAELMAGAEFGAQSEPTAEAASILARINGVISGGGILRSPQQDLELLQRVLPTVEPAEASNAFNAFFDIAAPVFIAALPESADVPTDEQLLAMGLDALDVKPEAEADLAKIDRLIDDVPSPAGVTTIVEGPAGIATAWLENNTVVHHRQMDERKDLVSVTITLAAGTIQESRDQHGLTAFSLTAWQRPATGAFTSSQISDFMMGLKVGINAGGSDDNVSLNISGDPEDLEIGFQLAHLMLTNPRIEQAAFDQASESMIRAIQSASSPTGLAGEVFSSMVLPPDEYRGRPVEVADVQRITRDAAQTWLDRIIATGPIEVAVVGDIDRERALDLVTRYIGTLPTRPRIGPGLFRDQRKIDRPVGPLIADHMLATETDKAIVQVGFFGADWTALEDRRHLAMAARIISSRMIRRLREELQLVYSIGVNSVPGIAFPGYGILFAASLTEPDKAEQLVVEIDRMFSEFATSGPQPDEMITARGQFANTLGQQFREPAFWAEQLRELTYRGTSLDRIMTMRADYATYTSEQIRDTFARYHTPEASFRMIVRPKQ